MCYAEGANMKYVLITGGTSGIGYALAKIFADNHYGIVIVSGNAKKLKLAKDNLEKDFNTDIRLIEQDLSKLGSAQKVYEQVRKMEIDISVLINNAGVGVVGSFEGINIEQDKNMLILNMITPAELCKLFLKDMYKKKDGKILNVASTGAFQPGPYTSTYYASKSFLLSLSKAIRYEAREKGVKVCVLCPGATKTEFFHRSGKEIPQGAMSADIVADYAYNKLMNNKEVIVPGIINKLMLFAPQRIRMLYISKFQLNLLKKYSTTVKRLS
jgi:short-subunit dehydrogenase